MTTTNNTPRNLESLIDTKNVAFILCARQKLPMKTAVIGITSDEAAKIFAACSEACEGENRCNSNEFVLLGVNRYFHKTPSFEGGFEDGFDVFQAADGALCTSIRHGRTRFPSDEESIYDFKRALASSSTLWYKIVA